MAAANPGSSKRWLFGPVPDLLFGCGVVYIGLFALFVLAGDWFLEVSPLWVPAFCVLVFSLPHYGATLLRVYEHRHDRRAYAIFSVWATLALVLAFVAGVYDAGVGSFLLTLYLTWSPWHYTGQNYGLAVMFLRRRGVPVTGATKRWLYGSFVLSYVLTFCVIHESSGWASIRSLPQDGPGIHFVSLGLPIADAVVAGVAIAWASATVVALARLARRAGGGDLVPVVSLVVTQALWFALPAAALHWGLFAGARPLAGDTVGAFLVWIAVGHSVQYLWVTSYYARAAADWKGAAPYFGKTLAAGALVWTLPVVLFAAEPLGAPSYEAGLAFLVASVVNLHHFVLDGAIWKLRNMRIAKVLVMSGESGDDGGDAGRPVFRGAAWSLATVCLGIAVGVFVAESWWVPRVIAAGDPVAVSATLDRLAWVGRDSARGRDEAGRLWEERRRFDLALAQYERSVAIRPAANAYGRMALMHAYLNDPEASVAAQDRALALQPGNPRLFEWSARLSEQLGLTERAADLRVRGIFEKASTPEGAESPVGKPALY